MKQLLCFISLFILTNNFALAQETFCEACSREAWLGDSAAINKFIASCGIIDTVSYDTLHNPVKEKAAYQKITIKLNSGKVVYADSIYFVVQQMPSFPGGERELLKFLNTNLNYPSSAKQAGISGTVYLKFIIERNGELSQIKVLRGTNSDCDKEAIRVLQSSPKWNPGMHKGMPVRVQYHLPVRFALN